MLRWMISPIVGNGTIQNPYRASVGNVPSINISSIIPTFTSGPNTGQPKYRFALCFVATPNVSLVAAVTNAFVFPDYNLDGRMAGMESVARDGFKQSVEAYDLDGNGLHLNAAHVDSDSYRDVITRIGQQIEPVFTVNGLSCAEVAA